jgi:cellobiose transport system permease protein
VLFFCSLAGSAFAKLRFRASNALMVFVIATLAIPDQLGIVALYIIMSKLPWLEGETWNGNLVAVIVPGLVSAFGLFYMRQFIIGAVPDELVESARVDGANTIRIYWSVVLPAIRPAPRTRPRWSRSRTSPVGSTCSTAAFCQERSRRRFR